MAKDLLGQLGIDSVREFAQFGLTFGVVGVVLWLTLAGKIDPDFLAGMASTIVGFWFGRQLGGGNGEG